MIASPSSFRPSFVFLPGLAAAALVGCLGQEVGSSSEGAGGAAGPGAAEAPAVGPGSGAGAGAGAGASAADEALPTVCPSLPPGVVPMPCGAPLANVGAPALHLDACALPAKNERIASWASLTNGIVMQGNPGALVCQGTLNGRPAVHFERDGFRLAAGDAVALDGAPEMVLAVVLQYTPAKRALSEAGGVVFQRTAATYPFAGPQLAGNVAYQAQSGAQGSFEPTELLGGTFRFGLKARGLPESTFAAIAPAPRSEPMLVVFRRLGGTVSLRVNGVEVASEERPDGMALPDGSGNPLNLGRNAGPNGFFQGRIGEVVFWRSTPPELGAAEGELMQRWGIAKGG